MINKIIVIVTTICISFSIDIFVPNDYDTIQEAVDAAINGYNAYHAFENNNIDGAINDGINCISHVGKAVEDGISGQWI